MKKTVRWLIVVGVLLSGLTCQLAQVQVTMDATRPAPRAAVPTSLPIEAPAAQVEEPVGGPQALPPDQALADQVNSLRTDLENLGGMLEEDYNNDGVTDFIYELEIEKLAERTYVMPSIGWDSVQGNYYEAYWELDFANFGTTAQTVTYRFEIPKTFVSSSKELIFEPQPTRIISHSPVVVEYTVKLAAKTSAAFVPAAYHQQDNRVAKIIKNSARLGISDPEGVRKVIKQITYPLAEKKCNAKSGDERDLCWLNLVEDFREILPEKSSTTYCTQIRGAVYGKMCLALVWKDVSYCKEVPPLLEDWEADVCASYVIADGCGAEAATQEDFEVCMGRESVKHHVTTGCLIIADADTQNWCLAMARWEKKYCERIPDPKKQQECIDALKDQLHAEYPVPEDADPDVYQPPPGVEPPGFFLPPASTAAATHAPPTPVKVDATQLNNTFRARVQALVDECNRLNCANHRNYSGCALDCRGVGGFLHSAVYSNYYLTIHRDYLPRAEHVAEYLLGNLKACNDPFVTSQANDRGAIYGACITRFNEEGARMLQIARDDTCAVWCSEQGKSGRAVGVPQTCVCD